MSERGPYLLAEQVEMIALFRVHLMELVSLLRGEVLDEGVAADVYQNVHLYFKTLDSRRVHRRDARAVFSVFLDEGISALSAPGMLDEGPLEAQETGERLSTAMARQIQTALVEMRVAVDALASGCETSTDLSSSRAAADRRWGEILRQYALPSFSADRVTLADYESMSKAIRHWLRETADAARGGAATASATTVSISHKFGVLDILARLHLMIAAWQPTARSELIREPALQATLTMHNDRFISSLRSNSLDYSDLDSCCRASVLTALAHHLPDLATTF